MSACARLVVATLCAATCASAAEPERVAIPMNAASLLLPSLTNGGVAVQYERFVAPPRLSIATSMGVRYSGGKDYDVIESGFGGECRVWFDGRAPFTHFTGRAMVGPYLGFRVDFGLTHETYGGHVAGNAMRVAESVSLGYRFAVASRIEITPSLGAGLRTEIDPRGRLPAWTRGEILRMGVTAGVLF